MDPPKLLSQVVVSVVHVDFRLMLTSLQELAVEQSITWPEHSLSVSVVICCGGQLLCTNLSSANLRMQPGSSQRIGLSWAWQAC